MSRYDYLAGMRKTVAFAKTLKAKRQAERSDNKPTAMQDDVVTLPPTAEEIGCLIKREVASALKKTEKKTEKKPTPKKAKQSKNLSIVKNKSGRREVVVQRKTRKP
eukprot:scpid93694/ scgid30696/ 